MDLKRTGALLGLAALTTVGLVACSDDNAGGGDSSAQAVAGAECGGKANLIKILYWDGTGLCLFTKRLEHRIFEWPTVGGTGETVSLTSAQLAMLIEGIDWRSPDRSWRPAVAG